MDKKVTTSVNTAPLIVHSTARIDDGAVAMYMASFPEGLPQYPPGVAATTFTVGLTEADVRRICKEVIEQLKAEKKAKRKAAKKLVREYSTRPCKERK